jgi:transposase-like protein
MGKDKGKVTASAEAVDNGSARRDGRTAVGAAATGIPDPEVAAKATRRRFTAEYKLQILREAERQREPGAIGALLRREGLYSTHLSEWRRERERGALESLRARRHGRKPDLTPALHQQIAALEAEKQRPQERVKGRPFRATQGHPYGASAATAAPCGGRRGPASPSRASSGRSVAGRVCTATIRRWPPQRRQ